MNSAARPHLLLAAEQAAEDVAECATLAAQHLAEDAADGVVAGATGEDAAQDFAQAAAGGVPLFLRTAAGFELVSSLSQHDWDKDRQQFLEQLAVAGTPLSQRRCDLVGVTTAEERRDGLVPVALAIFGMTAGDRFDLVSVFGIIRVLLQSAEQRRDQSVDRVVYLALVGAELVSDFRRGNLGVEIIETGHRVATFVAGMCGQV